MTERFCCCCHGTLICWSWWQPSEATACVPAGHSPSGKLVVDMEKGYKPISRLGGNTYGRTSGLFDLPRPDRGPAQQKLAYTSTAT